MLSMFSSYLNFNKKEKKMSENKALECTPSVYINSIYN